MPQFKLMCFQHWMWNCRVCNQTQQQAQISTTSMNTRSPVTEAASSSKPISPGTSIETDKPTPPVAPTENSVPVTATFSTSVNEATQQGQKRKEVAATTSTPVSSISSMPNKRLKGSKRTIDCKVALKVLRGINFFDTRFINSGKVLAWSLDPNHPDHSRIHEYFANTQLLWGKPTMKILSILRIITAAHKMDSATPLEFIDYPDASEMHRLMLWHEASRSKVSTILENGFSTPYYPGRSIFLADGVAESRFGCSEGLFDSTTGYLFLCDVLLGRKGHGNELNFRSTVGNIQCHTELPPKWMDQEVDEGVDGCKWPYLRWTMKARESPYNVFVVHNPAQVHPKYLIKFELELTDS